MNETYKRIISSLILVPIALFFIILGDFFFIFFMLIFLIINSYEWIKMSKKKNYLFPGLIFILFSVYSAYLLRGDSPDDLVIFLLVILICVSTDIGGYCFGKFFKGPKLIKKISPNKTYAGMFGGYFLSIIFVYILTKYSFFIDNNLINNFGYDEFIFVLIISTVSQIGDLIISFFKRCSKIKNTGNILPGHGGLLDRVDGMIFAVPFAYIYLFLLSN